MGDTKYKRILLKISGEALAGDAKIGINDDVLKEISTSIKAVSDLVFLKKSQQVSKQFPISEFRSL